MKFPKKVLGSGVVIKVIVNMSFVNVGADKTDICPLSCTRSFHPVFLLWYDLVKCELSAELEKTVLRALCLVPFPPNTSFSAVETR